MAIATKATKAVERTDTRQRTESDADYQRVKRQTAARLTRSLRGYARELRASGGDGAAELRAQTAFIRRHTLLLRAGYQAGHGEGQRDYWQAVSLRRPRLVVGNARVMHRRVAFYLPSVVKMARELALAWHEERRQAAAHGQTPVKQFAGGDTTVNPSEIDALMASMDWRVQLQAEVSWVGVQDGYAAGGANDAAGVYDVIYWDVEPGVNHCLDCILVAGGSPYTLDTLNQTPGDGRTQCGAGCKCDLRYGVSANTAPAKLAARLPGDYPIPGQQQTVVPRPPTDGTLSTAQKQALDTFRASLARWDEVRGGLPPLETLLAPQSAAEASAWSAISIEQLNSAQRKALDGYVSALGEWAATFSPDELAAVAQPSDWEQMRAVIIATTEAAGAEAVARPTEWEQMRAQAISTARGQTSSQEQTTIADTTSVNGVTTRDVVRVTPGNGEPQANLNAGQQQALDDIQGVALLWNEVRGQLPAFDVYFDPTSTHNLWRNRDLVGLTQAQQQLVARYFRAMGDWQTATADAKGQG
jgi:hypothetical protein